MTSTKSYWDKYAAQRLARRSRDNLLRRRRIGARRASAAIRGRRVVR